MERRSDRHRGDALCEAAVAQVEVQGREDLAIPSPVSAPVSIERAGATLSPQAMEHSASLAIFTRLWGAAVLFSQTSHLEWFTRLRNAPFYPSTLVETALVLCALLAVMRPWSLRGLIALAGIGVVNTLIWLPNVSNHRHVLLFVHLAVLLSAVGVMARRWRGGADEGLEREGATQIRAAVFAGFAPTARLIVVIVYAFAFFAKLNYDYADPTYSCAVKFYRNMGQVLTFLPDTAAVHALVIHGSLIVEGLLPIMLLWPRLRTLGVVVGMLFHFGLAFDLIQHFLDFSSVMFALLFLFLPSRAPAEGEGGFGGGRTSFLRRLPVLRVLAENPGFALGVGFVLVLCAGVMAASDPQRSGIGLVMIRQIVWVAYGLAVIAIAAPYLRPGMREVAAGIRLLPPSRSVAWLLIAVVVLNGLSPFLGLKTRTSFNMYSNLIVGPDESNHWIVPRGLDLLGYTGDSVEIVSSNDETLIKGYRDQGLRMTYFMLCAHASSRSDLEVVYRRAGKEHRLAPGDGLPPDAPPWILRKLLLFQPVGREARNQAIW